MIRNRKLSQSAYARRVAGGVAAVACALAATLPAVLPWPVPTQHPPRTAPAAGAWLCSTTRAGSRGPSRST